MSGNGLRTVPMRPRRRAAGRLGPRSGLHPPSGGPHRPTQKRPTVPNRFFRGRRYRTKYAYDARDARRLWEANIGNWHQQAEKNKKDCLVAAKYTPAGMWLASAAMIGAKLVVPDLMRGLIGFDPKTGKRGCMGCRRGPRVDP